VKEYIPMIGLLLMGIFALTRGATYPRFFGAGIMCIYLACFFAVGMHFAKRGGAKRKQARKNKESK
jgi:hypothetical protein